MRKRGHSAKPIFDGSHAQFWVRKDDLFFYIYPKSNFSLHQFRVQVKGLRFRVYGIIFEVYG